MAFHWRRSLDKYIVGAVAVRGNTSPTRQPRQDQVQLGARSIVEDAAYASSRSMRGIIRGRDEIEPSVLSPCSNFSVWLASRRATDISTDVCQQLRNILVMCVVFLYFFGEEGQREAYTEQSDYIFLRYVCQQHQHSV